MTTMANSTKQGEQEVDHRLKILVPSVAAGAIIGKGGETISKLQKDTKTRIIMSKVRDFYPGTNERVCLIIGNVDGILSCLDFVAGNIREKPDNRKTKSDLQCGLTLERENQVKILVPNTTASMIIGEKGRYINQIKNDSGAVVQVSQKCNDLTFNSLLIERCVTITGDVESNRLACRMILDKIVQDPHSGICSNVSYVGVSHPPNSNPTGSPFAFSDASSASSVKSPSFSNSSNSSVCNVSQESQSGAKFKTRSGDTSSPVARPSNSLFIENIEGLLRANGCLEHVISEIICALTTLESLGVLNFILSVLNNSSVACCSTDEFQKIQYHSPDVDSVQVISASDASVPAGAFAGTDAASVDPALHFLSPQSFPNETVASPDHSYECSPIVASAPVRDTFAQTEWNDPPLQAVVYDYEHDYDDGSHHHHHHHRRHHQQLQLDATAEDATQIDIEVPEAVVGAVLGRDGKVLVEIQQLSGANVRASKNGISTGNRIVSIGGSSNAICTALSLIEQRVAEAQLKLA